MKPEHADEPSYASFVRFLRSVNPAETARLVCLGDLFDFWCEYKHVVFSGYFPVLRAFADLNDAGVALHLVCGNHDFWAGAFLETQLGFHVHREATRLPFGDTDALLLHGDGLNRRDYGYRLFKRIARNPWAMRFFRHVHPDTAMALAQFMSRSSRTLTQVDTPAEGPEAQCVRQHARRLLENGDAAIVICGHAHAPEVKRIPSADGEGLYVNPGDWPHHRSYIIFDGAEFHLQRFE